MSEKMRESISALMDGEASEFETRRVLESVESAEMREVWARYHAASAAMKRDAATLSLQIDISAAVSQAIAKEEALVEPRNRPMKTAAGFATAATIAFAAVIGVQNFTAEEEAPVPALAASPAAPLPSPLRGTPVVAGAGRYVPPLEAPSASLVNSASFGRPHVGIQPVTMAGNAAFIDEGRLRDMSSANQMAAQRQLETFLARHAELAGTWRPVEASASSSAGESQGGQWQARWLPSGYRLVAINNDVDGDSARPVLTSVYSNGLAAFSVFVSSSHDEPAMDMKRGTTVACSRRIQSGGQAYNATVVGEIPQLAAERVATSVYQSPSQ